MLIGVLPTFSNLVDLHKGKSVHGYMIRNGFESHDYVKNGLIDMYANALLPRVILNFVLPT